MTAMITYGRTPQDVLRWPDDPVARHALEEYLRSLPPEGQPILSLLYAQGLDFTGANLSRLELVGATLDEATLTGVSLVGADLARAWLNGAMLRGADLSDANLRKAEGRQCDAQRAVFRGAAFDRCDFAEADLRHVDLSNARFGRGSLFGADLRGADLRECVFGHEILSTRLRRARIAGCRVEGASGTVRGPADVGEQTPQLLDGTELQRWFAEHGAPLVEVRL